MCGCGRGRRGMLAKWMSAWSRERCWGLLCTRMCVRVPMFVCVCVCVCAPFLQPGQDLTGTCCARMLIEDRCLQSANGAHTHTHTHTHTRAYTKTHTLCRLSSPILFSIIRMISRDLACAQVYGVRYMHQRVSVCTGESRELRNRVHGIFRSDLPRAVEQLQMHTIH